MLTAAVAAAVTAAVEPVAFTIISIIMAAITAAAEPVAFTIREFYREPTMFITAAAAVVAVEPVAFTIRDFCRRNSISVTSYYKLRAAGLGPKEMRRENIKLVRISLAAEREWQQTCENPEGAEAEAISRAAEAMRSRTRKAAHKSVASPRHVSRRHASRQRDTV